MAFFFSKEISSFENTFDAEHFFFLMQIIMSGERGRGGGGGGKKERCRERVWCFFVWLDRGNEEERSFKFTRVTKHNFIVVSTEEERTDIDNI